MEGHMKNESAKKAICLGVLCAVAYLAVYIARNTLGAVAPKTGFSEAFLGKTSSVYFVSYAVGQLINGVIGDRIKARNMISFGLFCRSDQFGLYVFSIRE